MTSCPFSFISFPCQVAEFCSPVTLKEAALDSPTFRATSVYFASQLELVERWLDDYVKAGQKLAHDVLALEPTVSACLQHTNPPGSIGEAAIDHDYTTFAVKTYTDAASTFWQSMFRAYRHHETNVLEPLRNFVQNDLRSFRDTKRALDQAQRNFDNVLSRNASQTRSREPSALREGAFQLHEARKAYLKTSLDFCIQGSLIRAALDKLLVRGFTDNFRGLKAFRDDNNPLTQNIVAMDRVRGWGTEMEHSERAFKRDLLAARRQIEENAETAIRPSRELEDYAERTTPYSMAADAALTQRCEKQGWLFIKSVVGKPSRTVWSRRWFFVRSGILGWLVQGKTSGGVEESEKIGLLLCSVRSIPEERRFCFEVKTKDTSIILQAETQPELYQWIDVFELAKRKALQDPSSTSPITPTSTDAAYSISPPIASELAVSTNTANVDDALATFPALEPSSTMSSRASVDASMPRRPTMTDRDGENTRDTASRIKSRLDMHRKPTPSTTPTGGIASLIAASHNTLPVGPGPSPITPAFNTQRSVSIASSSLAPSTLVNPPAPTSLSRTAVFVSGERGINLGSGNGMGCMANLWGSEKWGSVNRLERDSKDSPRIGSRPTSPKLRSATTTLDQTLATEGSTDQRGSASGRLPGIRSSQRSNTMASLQLPIQPVAKVDNVFPSYYPQALKSQDAQFRTLFPAAQRSEKVVLVFRATWNPNEHQEFPGRVYVTSKEIYFYSNHLGFVLITGVALTTVIEITAAAGRDCDYLYVHLRDGDRSEGLRRVTIKTFLEPLKLLHRRLQYLVENANADTPAPIVDVMKTLIKLEALDIKASKVDESGSDDNEYGQATLSSYEHDVRPALRIDDRLMGGEDIAKSGKELHKFRLPTHPIVYVPQDMAELPMTRQFTSSAKALFHSVFGDKSAVFQSLCTSRLATKVVQGPWTRGGPAIGKRTMGFTLAEQKISFEQTIEIENDHLCYVVTQTQRPWNFPWSDQFDLVTKYVITHAAKSRCQLSIYHKLMWRAVPSQSYAVKLVHKRAMRDLVIDAADLFSLVGDQLGRLGSKGSTNKAIRIYGSVGVETQTSQITSTGPSPVAGIQKPVRRYTLTSLYWHEALRQSWHILEALLHVLEVGAIWTSKVISANSVITVLLLVSAVFNLCYSYTSGSAWYKERNAARYMAQLGVGGSRHVSGGVYLHDIDALVRTTTNVNVTTASDCRDAFHAALNADYGHSSVSQSTRDETGHGAKQLQRTRERIAEHRHDMLVALRVLNRIEQEAMQAEWEAWVRDETRSCRHMSRLLEQDVAQLTQANGSAAEVDELRNVDRQLAVYCDSCTGNLGHLEHIQS